MGSMKKTWELMVKMPLHHYNLLRCTVLDKNLCHCRPDEKQQAKNELWQQALKPHFTPKLNPQYMKLIFASNNQGKLKEVQSMIKKGNQRAYFKKKLM